MSTLGQNSRKKPRYDYEQGETQVEYAEGQELEVSWYDDKWYKAKIAKVVQSGLKVIFLEDNTSEVIAHSEVKMRTRPVPGYAASATGLPAAANMDNLEAKKNGAALKYAPTTIKTNTALVLDTSGVQPSGKPPAVPSGAQWRNEWLAVAKKCGYWTWDISIPPTTKTGITLLCKGDSCIVDTVNPNNEAMKRLYQGGYIRGNDVIECQGATNFVQLNTILNKQAQQQGSLELTIKRTREPITGAKAPTKAAIAASTAAAKGAAKEAAIGAATAAAKGVAKGAATAAPKGELKGAAAAVTKGAAAAAAIAAATAAAGGAAASELPAGGKTVLGGFAPLANAPSTKVTGSQSGESPAVPREAQWCNEWLAVAQRCGYWTWDIFIPAMTETGITLLSHGNSCIVEDVKPTNEAMKGLCRGGYIWSNDVIDCQDETSYDQLDQILKKQSQQPNVLKLTIKRTKKPITGGRKPVITEV